MLEDFLLLLGLLGLVGSIGMRWVLQKRPPVEPAISIRQWRDEPDRAGPVSARPLRKRRCR